MGVQIYI